MKELTAKFDLIRYANVWEDAEMLIQTSAAIQGKKVASIASAGDNCFALLAQNPSCVVAVDVSPVQLYLTELKAMAIKHLPLEKTEQFLGFVSCTSRMETYTKLRLFLSKECQSYWDANIEVIEQGVIHAGKFEKYLSMFAKKILPKIHSSKKVERLFETKSEEEQKEFYNKKWNTLRWRILFKIFFSKFLMGRLGRDKSFLNEVNVNVSQFMLDQSAKAISSDQIFTNYIMRYCLTGSFGNLRPYYLQKENYARIKKNIDKLTLECCYIDQLSESYGQFDYFNLSNIFEYMDVKTFEEVKSSLKNKANEGAVFAYWNLMVPRKIENTNSLRSIIKSAQDRGFFYRAFHLDQLSIV